MVSTGSYIVSVASLALLVLTLGWAAVRLRRRLMPSWQGPPAHLVDAIVAIALLIWLSEVLGIMGILYAWTLLPASLALAGAAALFVRPPASAASASAAGGAAAGVPHSGGPREAGSEHMGEGRRDRTRGPALLCLITIGVIAVVFAHWGLTTKMALDRGIFNFDSLWYHMPFAVEIAQSHSVTELHHTETVYTNWFYPQNSELLHAVGILLTERDTLSLFINFGWLAIAFLAAWCVGRPYGRGNLCVAAAAILLACHTLVVREPGAAKNDLVAASLLLASIAILLTAWVERPHVRGKKAGSDAHRGTPGTLPPGWPLAAAGLAVGLAVGTKVTALAMAAGLTVAIVALSPVGRRWTALGWWLVPAVAGGGYWYLRNLIAAGNPLPQVERLGPIELPHPETLQSGRPDFSIAHYATDTGVWREYFGPGLDQAFGALWPLLVLGALLGAGLALARGGDRVLRWAGGVALLGLLAYFFTPLGASGAEGEPEGFAINIRFVIPALLASLVLLPLALPAPSVSADGPKSGHIGRFSARRRWEWALFGALIAVLVVTDRSDTVVRDPDRLFALSLAALLVLLPALLLLARRRGASRGVLAGGLIALAVAVAAIGYPVQRDYLGDRFAPGSELPGMNLNSAYHWARDVEDARIGLAGTSAGFLGHGFYGTDLSNDVHYLGEEGPHGAFNAIPGCGAFRAAVNEADLDYLVTAPFLNFIDPGEPLPSPEAVWLRGERAMTPIDRSGAVTVWRVDGRLDPGGCRRPLNGPLRHVPQQPTT